MTRRHKEMRFTSEELRQGFREMAKLARESTKDPDVQLEILFTWVMAHINNAHRWALSEDDNRPGCDP